MPEIRHFSLDTEAQTLADAVKEDGAIIIDDVSILLFNVIDISFTSR